MSRRAAAFTQADVHRALKAAMQAQPGVAFAIELDGATLRIVPVDRTAPARKSVERPVAPEREIVL